MSVINPTKRFFPALVAASLVLSIVGCGGSGDSSSSIPKAQFVKQANAICEQARKDAAKALQPYIKQREKAIGKTESYAELAAAGIQATVLPRIEKQNEELSALGTPTGDHAKLDEYLASLQGVATKGTEGKPIPEAKLQQLFKPSAESAREYGIAQCAYGS